ncbi:hypothetical protein GE061_015491 [Apolygus lucorum]|uniref:Uncharacterized protein n=1 Tax=Apolygus lucorum TaxID=248454 RepID=A0A6A4JJJ5_APOLU|nr:hypothetical protein GE061_015491 [Apolygus lucorum]
MKLALILTFTAVVVGFPAENQDSAGNGMSDLINSINKIQTRIKDMRGIAMGNSTEGLDVQIKDGINSMTKNVTYEDLIGKVQQASAKIKEMQALLSGTLKNLDKKYPRPSDTQQPEKV